MRLQNISKWQAVGAWGNVIVAMRHYILVKIALPPLMISA
jgi:hypothetical protein